MINEGLTKIALNSSQNQLRLKQGCCKYTMAWLNHWGIGENDILQNIDNVKNIITSKFKEKFWCCSLVYMEMHKHNYNLIYMQMHQKEFTV